MYICSKFPTQKTAFRFVSVQVQLANYQCQTNGHTFIGMPNQWASMSTRQTHTINCKCQINRHNLVSCSFRCGTNYSFTALKAEYFSTNEYLEIYVTSFTSIYIYSVV